MFHVHAVFGDYLRWHTSFIRNEYRKLRSLQSFVTFVRTTRRTKTANITKDDATSASHPQKVIVLQK